MIRLTKPELDISLCWTPQELQFFETYKDARKDDILDMYKNKEVQVTQKMIHQVFARQQVKTKLPFLFNLSEIVYPATLSLEQSSSQETAIYKASLFHGDLFIDLCGGLGIDSYFLSENFRTGILVERNPELAAIVSHNYALLNRPHVQFACGQDASDFLSTYEGNADLIYIDPARRNDHGGKIVKLGDCEPNVFALMDKMFAISATVLIKTSPLLDIQLAVNELNYVKKVYVIAVENECKELLFHLEDKYEGDLDIQTVNLEKGKTTLFSFGVKEEKEAATAIGEIKKYLYEPNAAIMKSGGFKSVALQFGLTKMHTHTHLYTSNELVTDFPGRRFDILAITKVDAKEVKSIIQGTKANVSIRNFPGSAQELKKKLSLSDGGDFYIFGTTDLQDKKVLLITKKVV